MTRAGSPPTRVVAVCLALLALAAVLAGWSAAPAGAETPPPAAQTEQEDSAIGADGAEPPTPTPAPTPTESDDLGEAIKQDARHFGWPLVVAVLVSLFLYFQGQVDRQEPKLADAPLDQGERLRFRS